MFSRRPDRPNQDTRSLAAPAHGIPGELPPSQWATVPAPGPADPVSVAAAQGDATVVGPRDRLEGTLRSAQGVLVLGSFTGVIESETWVRLAEGSAVTADITAQEVIVAGRCSGQIVATARLEIAPTGHVTGDIQAPRLALHEGGVIDGGLYMTRKDVVRPTGARPDRTMAATAPEAKGPGSVAPQPSPEPATNAGPAGSAKQSVRESGRAPSPRSGAATIPVSADPASGASAAEPEVPAAR